MIKRASKRALCVEVAAEKSVTAEIRRPAGFDPAVGSGVILAHGAGSDMTHPFMTYFFDALGKELLAARFNFLYTEAGRKAPDPARRLEATYRAVLADVAAAGELPTSRLFIGGKSMGGRMATHLAAEDADVAGVILLGYPLHAPGRTDKLRAAHLASIRCPMLFIQGTRDKLCELDLLRPALKTVKGPVDLHVIDEGDHSFKVPKRTGRSYEDVLAEIRDVVVDWMRRRS